MIGGRKIRSNKGKKRGSYRSRKNPNNLVIRVNNNGNRTVTHIGRHSSGRKVRSNKGKKRGKYGPRTGKTRSGKRFRQAGGQGTCIKHPHNFGNYPDHTPMSGDPASAIDCSTIKREEDCIKKISKIKLCKGKNLDICDDWQPTDFQVCEWNQNQNNAAQVESVPVPPNNTSVHVKPLMHVPNNSDPNPEWEPSGFNNVLPEMAGDGQMNLATNNSVHVKPLMPVAPNNNNNNNNELSI